MQQEMSVIGGLSVAQSLVELADEMSAALGLAPERVWQTLEGLVVDQAAKNAELLNTRAALQKQIDAYHQERVGQAHDAVEYESFLRDIGYLEAPQPAFSICPQNVDEEVAKIAGAQLVVPVNNARYALNAANARWGSLYDALYGTDVIDSADGAERGGAYNPARGAKVFARCSEFLDQSFPLLEGSHANVVAYARVDDALEITLAGGGKTSLAAAEQFCGSTQDHMGERLLLCHHGLHAELLINRASTIGADHPAGLADVLVESALSNIQDCEDSVAVVDAQDKALAYRNWLGLMRGDLCVTFQQGGREISRTLAADRQYVGTNGQTLKLHGRCLLLVRNVGMHMYTDAVRDAQGNAVPEAFVDLVFTTLAGMHDLAGIGPLRNSRAGSIYIVKPKMHGSAEVAFNVGLFAQVEGALGLAENTLKIGIMDEERRTSVNLHNCIAAAAERVIFINTGFLDRTGDEIHTAREAGPVLRKADMKSTPWIGAYENQNVDIGLACGFSGRAQIGKGMWAVPDNMAAMMEQKIGHPRAGANCAWVPSPTAATLHALHYHMVDVFACQAALAKRDRASLTDILTIPLHADIASVDAPSRQQELDNNAQGILGYVVRWVDQGIGCSKVPDIHNVGLMEDRATLRISAQHIANWLHHGVVSEAQVHASFKKMAAVVDQQNAGDSAYQPMADSPDSNIAFNAALELAVKGLDQANGYTEFVLTRARREVKKQQAS